MLTKIREKTNLTSSMVTSKPDCEATILGPSQFRLSYDCLEVLRAEEAGKTGVRVVERIGYGVDRERVRVCNDTLDG